MLTNLDLSAVTDRVLGLSAPRIAPFARLPGRSDRPLGPILLLFSALASATGLGLWAAGHGDWAARVVGAAVLLLVLTLRLL